MNNKRQKDRQADIVCKLKRVEGGKAASFLSALAELDEKEEKCASEICGLLRSKKQRSQGFQANKLIINILRADRDRLLDLAYVFVRDNSFVGITLADPIALELAEIHICATQSEEVPLPVLTTEDIQRNLSLVVQVQSWKSPRASSVW